MTPEKKLEMLAAFDAFTDRITDRYQEARDLLELGRYLEAQQVLARLAISHAKTSLSLRNFLIRQGLQPEEEK